MAVLGGQIELALGWAPAAVPLSRPGDCLAYLIAEGDEGVGMLEVVRW